MPELRAFTMDSSSNTIPAVTSRRRRIRHQWGEASNPQDISVRRVAWLFVAGILATIGFFVYKSMSGQM